MTFLTENAYPMCLRSPDNCRVLVQNDFLPMEADESGYTRNDIRLETSLMSGCLDVTMSARQTPVSMLALRWNGSWSKDLLFLGDEFERGYGTFEWRKLHPTRMMAWYFAATDLENTLMLGVMTQPDAFCFWQADAGGVTLWLDVRNGGAGVILNGKTICPARIRQTSYPNTKPYDALCAYCKTLCENPLTPPHPAFGSNNWYYAYGRAREEDIIEQARETLMWSEGLPEKPYVVIDDCWQQYADLKGAAGRPYECGNPRFPDMSGLARRLTDMGCRPGIWVRAQENLDRTWKGPHIAGRSGERVLDCSALENLDLIGHDIERVTSWGYELVKYDFVVRDLLGLYVRSGAELLKTEGLPLAERDQTNAMCIKALCKVIFERSHGAALIGCNVPGHLAAGYIHIHRGGDDTNAYRWDRTLIMGVNTLAFRLCQHGSFFAMDADCVGIVKDGIPWEQNRKFLDLLAQSGTPLFISATPRNTASKIHSDISAAFKTWFECRHDMRPLDWTRTPLPEIYLANGKTHTYDWIPTTGLEKPWRL